MRIIFKSTFEKQYRKLNSILQRKVDIAIEKFEVNPNLNNYKFFKAHDTFTAFQNLQSYISGVLGTKENDIIEVSNKSKIIKAGFDLKTSFRKEKKK